MRGIKRNWSIMDCKYLRSHAGLQNAVIISKHLNRTPAAVRVKARKLSISLRKPLVDLVGMKFGRWTVVRKSLRGWRCQCCCGIRKTIEGSVLMKGKSKGCRRCMIIPMMGKSFGRWTVISKGSKPYFWLCHCRCGTHKDIDGRELRQKRSTSCGCRRDELATRNLLKFAVPKTRKHGLTGSPSYRSWRAMLDRCYGRTRFAYRYYGGAGVTVCSRWRGKKGFQHFYADLGPRPEGMTLGRFGDIGNYQLTNVKWMDSLEQGKQRRLKNQLRKAA